MKKKSVLVGLFLFTLNSYAIDVSAQKPIKGIDGTYRSGNETLFFDSRNNIFSVKRSLPKFQDVAIPICYDTLARGKFKVLGNNAVVLFKDTDFYHPKFDVRQEKYLSPDTVYFKIVLPKDDAFFPDRFRFLLNFGCTIRQVRSDTALIKVPRKALNQCEHDFLSLVVQDLVPQWTIEEEKPYQRIYFRIFDLLPIRAGQNYFTISLWNFNECFVERMDIQNDIIYFDGKDSVFWRGKAYKRVRASPPA